MRVVYDITNVQWRMLYALIGVVVKPRLIDTDLLLCDADLCLNTSGTVEYVCNIYIYSVSQKKVAP